jgi:alanyl-tRNA synthetase
VDGLRLLAAEVEAADAEELLALSDRLKQALGRGAAVVLGARAEDRAMLVANFDTEAVAAGLSAVAVIREIAPLVDGGGGGREAMARAGGKDPARLPEAIAAAEDALRRAAGRDTA